MIIKFIANKHDFIRESNKAALLRVDYDKYVWIPNQFIELFGLINMVKVIAPDDIRLNLYQGDLKFLQLLEQKDKLTDIGNVSIELVKKMYYKYNNFTI